MFEFNVFNLSVMADFEIQLGNAVVESGKIPALFVKQHYYDHVRVLGSKSEPMKATYTEVFVDEDDKEKTNIVSFANNAYINSFPDEFT